MMDCVTMSTTRPEKCKTRFAYKVYGLRLFSASCGHDI